MTIDSPAPDFVEVEKLPIPVLVEFAPNDIAIQTLEGSVQCKQGDAILTGVNGERWPVPGLRFLASYVSIPPTQQGLNGTYLKRPARIWAKKMDQSFMVKVGFAKDLIKGLAGDWLLQYADGSEGVVAAEIFEKTYRVIFPAKA